MLTSLHWTLEPIHLDQFSDLEIKVAPSGYDLEVSIPVRAPAGMTLEGLAIESQTPIAQ